MHACGHDVHSATLLGAAAILQRMRSQLHGVRYLVFQPGEEKLPGGASIMIREGLLEKTKPDWIAALHVFPSLPAGHVGFRSGLYMASADEIYITVTGKGGHAATPHVCIDPIPVAARIITALQEVISRRIDPLIPAVLTIGRIYSDGGATNVIPDKVMLEGTLRAMDETWRFNTHDHIRTLVQDLCTASGAKSETRIEIGYPCLVNHDVVTQNCRHAAGEFLGTEKIHELPQRMTSEDFAFFSQQVPATFFRLGTGWTDRENYPVHSNRFDVNEQALETGMGLMAFLALKTV
jgi:amidohydrolase